MRNVPADLTPNLTGHWLGLIQSTLVTQLLEFEMAESNLETVPEHGPA